MKILVVEDDVNTRKGLVEIFQTEGYTTIEAVNGKEGLEKFANNNPDIVCLDIMIPHINGYDVCKKIREQKNDVPIIFISAKSEEIDKVVGLELGADDYIIKPFGVKEVVARIRAVSRRYLSSRDSKKQSKLANSFMMKDLKVVPVELRVYRGDTVINLSIRDIKILEFLHINKGKVLDRNVIFDECWGVDYLPSSRTLDQHISQLRKKIEINSRKPLIIQTVQGVGYRFEE
jgi:two-component system, OmpR family, alkaline phosphatase synthesis response regulator PhoP